MRHFQDALDPPPYTTQHGRSGRPRAQPGDVEYDQSGSESVRHTQHRSVLYSQPSSSSHMRNSGFRPLALPQVTYGEGKPFLRGYSDELMRYEISEKEFIRVVDSLNEAIIPNPENQIFQKGAQIAGYFVPGADGMAIAASRIAIGIGTFAGHAATLGRRLSQANLSLFIPRGLEICIGKVHNVDEEAGFSPSSRGFQDAVDPQDRVLQYGEFLMQLSIVYPQQDKVGRQDPIAMIGRGMSAKDNQRQIQRATRERDRGRRSKKGDSLEQSLQWLIVRKAAAESTAHWQQTLSQSGAALAQEQEQRRRGT